MCCCLLIVKPLTEPMLTNQQLDSQEQASNQCTKIPAKKMYLKMLYTKWDTFCLGSVCQLFISVIYPWYLAGASAALLLKHQISERLNESKQTFHGLRKIWQAGKTSKHSIYRDPGSSLTAVSRCDWANCFCELLTEVLLTEGRLFFWMPSGSEKMVGFRKWH